MIWTFQGGCGLLHTVCVTKCIKTQNIIRSDICLTKGTAHGTKNKPSLQEYNMHYKHIQIYIHDCKQANKFTK